MLKEVRGAPRVTDMKVVPVAGQDSMLLNLLGAHAPYFTRNLVILTDSAGNTGVGEVPGGEKIRQTLEDARDLVIGARLETWHEILGAVGRRFGDRCARREVGRRTLPHLRPDWALSHRPVAGFAQLGGVHMRIVFGALVAVVLLAPALAQAQITCAQLPKAEAFVNTKLKPGPNTNAARRHLQAAKQAKSNARCVAELRKVDYYAKRSMAADKRAAANAAAH